MEFNPNEWALLWLKRNGFPAVDLATLDDSEILDLIEQMLTKRGRLRASLSRTLRFSNSKVTNEIEDNVGKTLTRIGAMKKVKAMRLDNPKGYAASRDYRETVARNVRNTLVGSLSRGLALWIRDHVPEEDQRKIKIKWKPSSAKVQDIPHARHYGQTMTLYRALRVGGEDMGLGVRYGCKCGATVVSGGDILRKYLLKSPYKAIVV